MSNPYFTSYLNRISKIPLLTAEQERQLGTVIHSQDNKTKQFVFSEAERQKALDTLVESNLRLSVSIANGYRNSPIGVEELTFEGNQGLIEAAKRYDPKRGTRFCTYASFWIILFIRQAVNGGHTVRTPLRRAAMLARIQACNNFDPDLEDQDIASIAKELGIDEEEVVATLKRRTQVIPLDAPLPDTEASTLQSALPSGEASADEQLMEREILDLMLKQLDNRELEVGHPEWVQQRQIIKRRFGLQPNSDLGESWTFRGEETLIDIARTQNITHERIRQLQQKGMEYLKKEIKRKYGLEVSLGNGKPPRKKTSSKPAKAPAPKVSLSKEAQDEPVKPVQNGPVLNKKNFIKSRIMRGKAHAKSEPSE